MKAILLAAGFGTRLRPLTNSMPKCLVPIKGKPLLDFWLDKLNSIGIKGFIINTHYLSEIVCNHINNSIYKDNIILTFESNLIGTAGTLIKYLNFINLDEDVILLHADNYCLDNFFEYIDYHRKRPKNCLMTMMTFTCDNPSNFGIVTFDDKNILTGFYEKQKSSNNGKIANAAIYILSKEMLKILKEDYAHCLDFSTDIIPKFLNKIYVYHTSSLIVDIGTIENYNKYK